MVSEMLYPCIFCGALLIDLVVLCVSCLLVYVICLVIPLAVYYVCGLSESEICIFGKLCPIDFLVVCECLSFFCCSLWSCRMFIMVMMGWWSDDSAC